MACGRFDLGLSKATLSHHFRVLREAGIVKTRVEGRKRLQSLRREDLGRLLSGPAGGGAERARPAAA